MCGDRFGEHGLAQSSRGVGFFRQYAVQGILYLELLDDGTEATRSKRQ